MKSVVYEFTTATALENCLKDRNKRTIVSIIQIIEPKFACHTDNFKSIFSSIPR